MASEIIIIIIIIKNIVIRKKKIQSSLKKASTWYIKMHLGERFTVNSSEILNAHLKSATYLMH